MATFDHELPTDEVEIMVALKKLFSAVGLAGMGRMNPCSRTPAAFWVGVLGQVEGTVHRCLSGDSMPRPRPEQSDAAPSRPLRTRHARQRWAHYTTL